MANFDIFYLEVIFMELNELPRGQLNPTILSTMIDGDKYGYEIIDEVKDKTGIEIKQPSLYSSLKRMETQKLVSSYWRDSAIGGKRHYYCLTAEGRKYLEENPVDYSLFEKQKEQNTEATPKILESKVEEPIKLAEQENMFTMAKKEVQQEKVEEKKEEPQDGQYNLFKEVDMARDDGRFITETIEDYNFPKVQKFEPASLNIEARDTSYLNAKIKEKPKADAKPVQEKMSDMLIANLNLPYDHEKSMAKIQHKIDKFEAERKQKEVKKVPEQPQVKQIKKEEFNRVENTYEREPSQSKIFSSYKSLEGYYTSKGIGFKQYEAKDSASNFYVNPMLVRLVRSFIFFVFSLVLSISFYFGLGSGSIGEIIYIIVPALALVAFIIYFVLYRKERFRGIIQIKKEDTSSLVLPMAAVALILVIIGINLILGFRAGKAIEYFPILIYPIVLSFHFGAIPYTTKAIAASIRKIREKFKYRF